MFCDEFFFKTASRRDGGGGNEVVFQDVTGVDFLLGLFGEVVCLAVLDGLLFVHFGGVVGLMEVAVCGDNKFMKSTKNV